MEPLTSRALIASASDGGDLPGDDLGPSGLLGGAGMRHRPAVPHRGRRGHVESGDAASGARPRAVAGGLRRAVHPARRRPLRREPVPLPGALPVPGHPEARARRRAGRVPRLAAGDRDPDRAARRAVRRGQLGEPQPGRVGPRLGGVDGRDGDHPVHLLPAGRRDRARPGVGRDHLRPRAARDAPPERAPGPRHDVVARRHVGRGARGGRAPVLGLQLRAGRHGDAGPALRRPRGRGGPVHRGRAAARRLRPRAQVLARLQPARLPPGRSRSPTGRRTSCGCGG